MNETKLEQKKQETTRDRLKRAFAFLTQPRQPEATQSKHSKSDISRRNFLKMSSQAAGAAVLSSEGIGTLANQAEKFAKDIEANRNVETEPHTITDNVTYIDIVSDYDHEQFAIKHVGENYRDFSIQLAQAEDRDQFIAQALIDEESAPFALMYLYRDKYQNMRGSLVYPDGAEDGLGHDKLVSETSQYLYDQTGWNVGEPKIMPLQDNINKIVKAETEDGLPALEITVDANSIIESLRENDSPIINMSFQVGTFRFGIEKMPEKRPKNYEEIKEGLFVIDEYDDVDYPTVITNENGEPIDSKGHILPPEQIPNPVPFKLVNGEKQSVPIFTREELIAQGFEFQDEFGPVEQLIQEAYSP